MTMDVILSTVKCHFALVYPDDIVVLSVTPEEHIDHAKLVLIVLQDAGVTFKLKKCKVITDTTEYLGHVISTRRLEIATHTTHTIPALQRHASVTELRSFFGLYYVFSLFVPTFARPV